MIYHGKIFRRASQLNANQRAKRNVKHASRFLQFVKYRQRMIWFNTGFLRGWLKFKTAKYFHFEPLGLRLITWLRVFVIRFFDPAAAF